MRAGTNSAANLYALITDHLGSVVAIVDSSGALVETYEYTPFGKTTIRNSSGTPISLSVVGNTLGFTGREMQILAFGWDNWVYEFSGLYYYRNRWYSPELGRFLQPDPIGLRARDVNLYRYVGNTPLIYVDPDGTILIGILPIIKPVIWCLIAAVVGSHLFPPGHGGHALPPHVPHPPPPSPTPT